MEEEQKNRNASQIEKNEQLGKKLTKKKKALQDDDGEDDEKKIALKRTKAIGLSKDFESFDILWFDIESRTRQIVANLCQPLVDKIHEHKDTISQLLKQADDHLQKIEDLETTVYNKDQKLTIFEEIYDRIAKVESERKVIETRLESNDELIMRTFDDQQFKYESNEKQIKTLISSTQSSIEEMRDLKDSTALQNKAFMKNLEDLSKMIVQNFQEVREQIGDNQVTIDKLQSRRMEDSSKIQSLLQRMDKNDLQISQLELASTSLFENKLDRKVYFDNHKVLNNLLDDLKTTVLNTKNLCLNIDQYQYKYLPVRIQTMIGDTLKACLQGDMRYKHSIYDHEKISLYYRLILEDKGGEDSNIEKVIIQLNEKAKHIIDEEEKKKRRKGNASFIGNNQSPIDSALSNEITQNPLIQQSIDQVKDQQVLHNMDSLSIQQKSINLETQKSIKSPAQIEQISKIQQNFQIQEQQSPSRSLIMDNHNVYKLQDLISSDFYMSADDKDYRLDLEQIVKVCKILLHKINFNQLRNAQQYDKLNKQWKNDLIFTEQSMKSSHYEVNQILQNVHSDLELFSNKTVLDLNILNQKIHKIQEVSYKTLENLDQIKIPIQNYATMLQCIHEYNYIQSKVELNQLDLLRNQNIIRDNSSTSAVTKLELQLNSKDNLSTHRDKVYSFAAQSINHKLAIPNYEVLSNQYSQSNAVNQQQSQSIQQDSMLEELKNFENLNKQQMRQSSKQNESREQNKSKCIIYHQNSKRQEKKVTYRNCLINFNQLFEFKKTLLDKCEQIVNSTEFPFLINPQNSEKLQKDLIQFHNANDIVYLKKSIYLKNSSSQQQKLRFQKNQTIIQDDRINTQKFNQFLNFVNTPKNDKKLQNLYSTTNQLYLNNNNQKMQLPVIKNQRYNKNINDFETENQRQILNDNIILYNQSLDKIKDNLNTSTTSYGFESGQSLGISGTNQNIAKTFMGQQIVGKSITQKNSIKDNVV